MTKRLDADGKQINLGYDSQDDMMKIKSLQKKFRDSFSSASLDTNKWDSVLGTGTISQASSILTIGSGTTANNDTYILSKEVFTVPFRLSIGLTMSQRIINQTFYVEAISVDPTTKVPDGKHSIGFIFDGTTATQAKYRVQNGGLTPLDSGLSTFPTTASGSVYEIEPFADEAWFHGGIIDSTNSRSNSYRRHQQIPDPNAIYKIRLRWLNGATAPASNTNVLVQYLAVQDYAELTAEITAGRGQAVAGQAIGVQITGSNATLPISGQVTNGQTAHDGAVTGNPVRIGARAVTANYTAVQTGDATDLISTLVGAIIQKPYSIPELDWQYAGTAVTTTTDVVLKTAGATGIKNYLTGLQLQNTGAVATEVVVKDGATVIWRGYLPASMTNIIDINFTTPIKGTAVTALNFACITTGANVYVNAQGYQAP